jgi:hypothetical protein
MSLVKATMVHYNEGCINLQSMLNTQSTKLRIADQLVLELAYNVAFAQIRHMQY